MEKDRENRIGYFSRIRGISCIAIIILHSFYIPLRLFAPGGSAEVLPMVIRNLMLWAVPLFVMVSGALLLDPKKEMPVSYIFRKYIKRAVTALLIFTFLFALFDLLVDGNITFAELVPEWLKKVFTGRSWLHMWYLYMLIGLYLMLPVYRAVIKGGSRDLLRYIFVLYLIFLSVLPTITYITGETAGFYILVSTVYPFYFFAGYTIHNDIIVLKRSVSLLLFIISTAAIVIITYLGYTNGTEQLISMVNSYNSAAVAIQSVSLFSIFKSFDNGDKECSKVMDQLDKCSFGIYLLHVMVLYVIFRIIKIDPFTYGAAAPLIMAAAALITAAASFLVTFLLRKIRIRL